ncbi:hypothetical protein SAMN06295974_0731 [Plantibacter flavus]|uniref:Uncharacterized protein n=1 Tax=Plantibacter flavus TaxID=150123 RepID=A0A3N2C1Y0_9MICO|nr:hypothetical protein [Plantibacter flavus]ROR81495.1 hypothetical protein EDD42_1557 [Plantibacter flavus]SMG13618.1 hypothetical protein SAMN06295974_0731 [Plantibacter flavus]
MIIRRAFYYWRFAAIFVLPAWPFVGWGLFGESGWSLFGLFIAMPILAIALAAIAFLISARASVRTTKLVSWMDAGLLTLWHVTIICFGSFSSGVALWAVLGVVASLAAFWGVIAQLISETARRARETMAEFERMAAAAGPGTVPGSAIPPQPRFDPGPIDGGEFIVIEESKPDERR